MRLHSLRLQHFRQHADTSIEFGDGLTGIVGANGAGKSTILEAIAWALYGAPAARGKKDSIRSMRAPARASVKVELEFELAGVRYRVVRGLTNAEVFINGSVTPAANSISGVAELLRAKLGMSLDEFFNTYFTGQKELSVMAAMGPTERGQFLSKLLGYERLRVAQELARERKRSIVAEATGMSAGMQDEAVIRQGVVDTTERFALAEIAMHEAASRRASAVDALGAVTPRWIAVQAERRALDTALADYRAADTECFTQRGNLERIDREMAEIAPHRAALDGVLSGIRVLAGTRADLEAMDALAKEEGRRQTLAEHRRDLTNDIVLLDERRVKLEVAPGLERETLADISHWRAIHDAAVEVRDKVHAEWVAARQQCEAELRQVNTGVEKLTKQRQLLAETGAAGHCPTCTQVLGDTFATVFASIDEQLVDRREAQTTLNFELGRLGTGSAEETRPAREELTAAYDAMAKAELRLQRIRAGMQELATLQTTLGEKRVELQSVVMSIQELPTGYSVERHMALQADVVQLQANEIRAAKLSGIVEREGQLRADRDRASALVGSTEARLAGLAEKIAGQEAIEAEFASLKAAYDAAAAERSSADVNAATTSVRCDNAAVSLADAMKALAEFNRTADRLAALNRDRRLHEDVDRAFSELRTDLNLQLRPEISVRASELLAELTDGRYSEAELDENYTLVLVEDNKPKSVISGGEEDLANLVLRLVISQMIAERAGQPLSLLILDEVFGSLDEARRQNVVALLRRLHDRFEQVIVITHTDSVRDDLDHTITVTYDDASASAVASQDVSAERLVA